LTEEKVRGRRGKLLEENSSFRGNRLGNDGLQIFTMKKT